MSRCLNPFTLPGRWYRGVFHCHTTNSDGARTIAEVIDWYTQQGYDFLAITDHNQLTRVPVNERDMRDVGRGRAGAPTARGAAATAGAPGRLLLVNGTEVDVGRTRLGEPYHLVGVGLREMIEVPRQMKVRYAMPAQDVVTALRAVGAVVYVAHPYWSGLILDDLLALDGVAGLEVFNANVEVDIGKGYSGVQWDDYLSGRHLLLGAANDDAHWRMPDYGRAWTMLRADVLTPEAVVEGLASGAFYASTGVVLEDVAFDGDTTTVRVAPPGAAEIRFICDHRWGRRIASGGAPLREAAYVLRGQERYIRVEVIGPSGERAWTNPLFLER